MKCPRCGEDDIHGPVCSCGLGMPEDPEAKRQAKIQADANRAELVRILKAAGGQKWINGRMVVLHRGKILIGDERVKQYRPNKGGDAK